MLGGDWAEMELPTNVASRRKVKTGKIGMMRLFEPNTHPSQLLPDGLDFVATH